MKTKIKHVFLRCLVTASMATVLAGWTTTASAGVIHSLNYSEREVSYIAVEAANDPTRGGGGDALNPYGEGGNICCFSAPAKWSPDVQVMVVYRFYPEKEMRRVLVNVPPYPNGEAGEIWLIAHEDGSAEAVVSNYGPDRPEWPGKIKGYPVPSKAYMLKLWERDVRQAKIDVASYEKLLKEFSQEFVHGQWTYDSERLQMKAKLKEFKGPDDPAYADYLIDDYHKGIDFFSTRLNYLLDHKP